MVNFPLGFKSCSYIHIVSITRLHDLRASVPLFPTVSGAISEMITSQLHPNPSSLIGEGIITHWEASMVFTASWSVMSWTKVFVKGRLISTFLRSKPMSNGSCFHLFLANLLLVYCNREPGAQPISITVRTSLPKKLNFSSISWSLKALRATYPSFFARRK